MRQPARVGWRAELESGHQGAEMRLGERGLAARERFESIQRGTGLAALEKSHAGEEVHLALLLGRQRQHLEGARRRVEDAIGEPVAARPADLQHQAIGAAGEKGHL